MRAHHSCCLGVIDSTRALLFDATPDIVPQLSELLNRSGTDRFSIFLTHAHVGHYTGLMHLGREAANTRKVPVYAMPRMLEFLAKNGPWNQLLKLQNIVLNGLENGVPRTLDNGVKVEPILVPHRDEFSETVGYYIKGPNKTALYIPDIDKWTEWEENILGLVPTVDYAFIDGTFFADGEIPRPMSEVPHPFVSESIALLKHLSEADRKKVYFIHLNHSKGALSQQHLEFNFIQLVVYPQRLLRMMKELKNASRRMRLYFAQLKANFKPFCALPIPQRRP